MRGLGNTPGYDHAVPATRERRLQPKSVTRGQHAPMWGAVVRPRRPPGTLVLARQILIGCSLVVCVGGREVNSCSLDCYLEIRKKHAPLSRHDSS